MVAGMNPLGRLVREAHRRSLLQVLGIYVVAGWIAIQVVQTLTESLGLPEWFPALAIVLLIVGLPVVLATAFVQEGMGGREERPAAEAPDEVYESPPARTSAAARVLTWRNALGGGVLAFALWGVIAAAWVVFGAGTRSAADRDEGLPSIAVLPFENLSPDPEAEQYFADGIHDELLRELARVAGLKVVSRTSVLAYRGTTKRVPEIAAELGVGAILEGTVRRADDRIRLTAQLIDGRDDTHLWAETYERDLADIFAVQSDLALRIAEGVGARLSPEEEEGLGRRPTASVEAYDLYLRARATWQNETVVASSAPTALELLRRATELDPDFAAAWGLIASIQAIRWVDAYDVNPETEASLRTALARALELDPEQPEASLARAYQLSNDQGDVEAAEAELRRTIRATPSFADAYRELARLRALQGDRAETEALLARALELEPANPASLFSAAISRTWLGDIVAAERLHRRALALDPTRASDRLWLASLLVSNRGDTAAARGVLREGMRLDEAGFARAFVEGGHLSLITLLGDPDGLLETTRAATFAADPLSQGFYHLARAEAALLRGDREAARVHAGASTRPFEDALAAGGPQGIRIVHRVWLAQALAILGEPERALEELDTAEDLSTSLGIPDWSPRYVRGMRAEAYALLGRTEDALALVATLEGPGRGQRTRHDVRHRFPWVLLRGEPAYEVFVAGG